MGHSRGRITPLHITTPRADRNVQSLHQRRNRNRSPGLAVDESSGSLWFQLEIRT